jgi:hypothetical protein
MEEIISPLAFRGKLTDISGCDESSGTEISRAVAGIDNGTRRGANDISDVSKNQAGQCGILRGQKDIIRFFGW